MNASKRSRRSLLKPIAVAVAFAVPTTTAFAEAMSNVVTTRADQTIGQQYGRDSVYAFSPASKPFTPDQTAAGSGNVFENIKSYSAAAWHKATDWLAPRPQTATSYEPQWYGRAGGYVGADRVAYLQSRATPAMEYPGAVKTETPNAGYDGSNEERTSAAPLTQAAPESNAADESLRSAADIDEMEQPPTVQAEADNGRTEGGRFVQP